MADEEITDLTDDGEASDAPAKGKKAKPPKAPKASKDDGESGLKKEKKPKAKKDPGEKGSSTAGVIIIMILVLLILLGGFGAALYLDMFDARIIIADVITEPLLDIVIWLDPAFSSINNRLRIEAEMQERRFAERTEDLDEREDHIIDQEEILLTRERQLERRALDLDRREEQILAMYERTVPLFRRPDLTEQDIEDMIAIGQNFTQMSPESAAEILSTLYDPRDAAGILYYMAARSAGSILAAMEPRLAAEITEILLYS